VKTLILFGFIIFIVFAGGVKLFSKIKTSSPFQYIFFSGTIYLLFGLIIGENGFRLVSSEILSHLDPILHFSLGWVGFIFGFQFEIKFLKKIPLYKYFVFILTYLFSFSFLFLFSFFVLKVFFSGFFNTTILLVGTSVILAFLLAESSSSFVQWSSRFFKKNFTELKLSAFISTMNNLIPILFTGIIFSIYSYQLNTGEIHLNGIEYMIKHFLFQICLAVFFGFSIYYLQKKVEERLDVSIVLFGSIFLISGISFMYNLSPLFIAMFASAIFTNLTKKHHLILKIINPTEKPIYLFFILILSFKYAYFSMPMFIFVSLLLFIKYYSNIFAFRFVNKLRPKSFYIPPHFSVFLIPVSSIGPAILVDMSLVYSASNTSVLSGIFILGLLIAEIISPLGVAVLQKKGYDD